MQVGLVLEQCLAPVPGGTGRYSRELALALARTAPSGSEVTGVTSFRRAPLRLDGVAVRRWPLPRRALVASWERGGPPSVPGDVVHAPTPLHPRRRDTPLVVTVHDAVPWTYPETLTPRGVRWHRAMVGRAAATADLLVVPTQAVADELARQLPLRDVLVVGEGVSADLGLPADADDRAARLGLPERYLLTVATLEPRKGLRELVTALREVPGIPLLCVGQAGWGGLSVPDLATAAGVDVRVLGRVPDADLAVLLDRATALVVPSYDEGFGLPLLEGMAAGTPVLTSTAPALMEVAAGAALAVPLDGLVDGLRQITSDEQLRARLRVAGPERAAGFAWDAAASRLWLSYADLHECDTRQA
ncbi:MAG: glycosyltransferase family 1 protein [Mycobacteriales bacterium]